MAVAMAMAVPSSWAKPYTEPVLLIGDGARLCHQALGYPCAPEHLCMQRASGTALAAYDALLRGEEADGATLQPNYLRLSQAERERNAKLQAQSSQ